jgi:predicted DCC family thiol-disulfide oxidoreductase YuxK
VNFWRFVKPPEPVHVVYDGQCAFCIRALRFVRTLDLAGRIRWYDAHDPRTLEAFPGLADADLDEAMYTVAAGGRVDRGFFAFRRLVGATTLMWPLLAAFRFPGAEVVGPRVYAWVARNRRRLGCRAEACELPSPVGSDDHRARV